MKKIIIVLPSLKSVSPIRAALALIRAIKNDFEVTVVSIDSYLEDAHTIGNDLDTLGIKVIYLEADGLKNVFKAYEKLKGLLIKHNYDIGLSYLLRADLILGFCKIENIKKISSIRNMIEHEYKVSHGKIAGKTASFFHLNALKKFDKIVVMSKDMENYFLDKNFDRLKLYLINNFLDEQEVNDKSRKEVEFPFNNGIKTIVTVSSLIKRKNIALLIKIAIELFKEGKKFNVLVLGEGEEKENLISLVNNSEYKDNFIFPGHVNNPLPYIKKSNIFVMTSLAEGVSRALMEALYLGKDCIVSNIDGNRELIDNANGKMFSNEIEFKDLLRKALESETKEENCLLPNDFRYTKNIKKYKTLFNKILD